MDVQNSLARLRAKRGLGASQLAAAVGISRQTVYAIEAGTYVPNTAVSLRLARILESSVEEIFQLDPEEQPASETAEAVVLGDPKSLPPGQPLRLCSVNGHLVAALPDEGGLGLPATDAVLLNPLSAGKRLANAKVKIFRTGWNSPSRILISGCDPSASILANALQRQGCDLVIAYENSSRSLELLHKGLVHVAGTHLANTDGRRSALLPAKMFARNPVAVISYAVWHEGLVVAKGNPKKISGVTDLSRKDVRIANREPGAGCRILLDELLREHGIASCKVRGYERISLGQLPPARLVQSGEVDCCVSTQAVARSLGLDFIPLAQRPYQLVLRRSQLNLPPVQTLIETLGRAAFRREVEACIGYDMRTAGDRLA